MQRLRLVRWLVLALGALAVAPVMPRAAAALVGATVVHAQVRPDSARRDSLRADSLRADSVRADSIRREAMRIGVPVALPPTPAQDTSRRPIRRAAVVRPPLSPRRAFLLSALVPGLAQSRLERGTSGALFAGVEMAALAMLRRSVADVREVRRQRPDTIPGNFTATPNGIVPRGTVPPRFEASLEASRRLHVEDWTAAIIFNHLIAGADAFVAAQLWDVPARVSVVPARDGLALVATLRF